jgi:hypothetical protein
MAQAVAIVENNLTTTAATTKLTPSIAKWSITQQRTAISAKEMTITTTRKPASIVDYLATSRMTAITRNKPKTWRRLTGSLIQSVKPTLLPQEFEACSDCPTQSHTPAVSLTTEITWGVDTGASHHLCTNWRSFLTYESLSRPIPITLRDESVAMAFNHGRITVFQGYCADALHTSTFGISQLSIWQLDDDGFTTIFSNSQCSMENLQLKVDGNRSGSIYSIPSSPEVCFTLATSSRASPSALGRLFGHSKTTWKITIPTSSLLISESSMWHKSLGHVNRASMKSLIQGYTHNHSLCDVCIFTNYHRKFIRIPAKKTSKPFELDDSDLCRPFKHPTKGGDHYWIICINDYARLTTVFYLPNQRGRNLQSSIRSIRFKDTTSWLQDKPTLVRQWTRRIQSQHISRHRANSLY